MKYVLGWRDYGRLKPASTDAQLIGRECVCANLVCVAKWLMRFEKQSKNRKRMDWVFDF